MSLLKEQQDSSTIATKQFLSNALSEFTEKSIERNFTLLATFGEGINEQLGLVNKRVENVKHATCELKSNFESMQRLISEVQEEQKRQGEVLLLAGRHGKLTQADLDSDEFNRPTNLEIVQTTSPKFVSLASIENAITPYMVTQNISDEVWRVEGKSRREKVFYAIYTKCRY